MAFLREGAVLCTVGCFQHPGSLPLDARRSPSVTTKMPADFARCPLGEITLYLPAPLTPGVWASWSSAIAVWLGGFGEDAQRVCELLLLRVRLWLTLHPGPVIQGLVSPALVPASASDTTSEEQPP